VRQRGCQRGRERRFARAKRAREGEREREGGARASRAGSSCASASLFLAFSAPASPALALAAQGRPASPRYPASPRLRPPPPPQTSTAAPRTAISAAAAAPPTVADKAPAPLDPPCVGSLAAASCPTVPVADADGPAEDAAEEEEEPPAAALHSALAVAMRSAEHESSQCSAGGVGGREGRESVRAREEGAPREGVRGDAPEPPWQWHEHVSSAAMVELEQ